MLYVTSGWGMCEWRSCHRYW